MSTYVRPELPRQVFQDASGADIDYGNRWADRPGRLPPDDMYSVVTHPERFAPLHTVADALIAHLAETYAVTVVEDPSVASDLLRRVDDAVRAVRLVPDNPDGAPLTVVYTAFPGVIVHAGLLHDFVFPDCGCDACDESVESAAEEMERLVLAVAAGDYAETVNNDAGTWIGYELGDAENMRRGRRMATPEELERVAAAARERFRALPRGWQPWPARAE